MEKTSAEDAKTADYYSLEYVWSVYSSVLQPTRASCIHSFTAPCKFKFLIIYLQKTQCKENLSKQ